MRNTLIMASMSLLLSVLLLATNLYAETIMPPQTVIPKYFFGLHIHRAADSTPWPSVAFGTWRLWDTYTAWPWLEPRKGEWRFNKLDKMVGLANEHQVQVVLPIGLTPAWASSRPTERSAYGPGFAAEPTNLEDWRNYVRTVVTRYKGKIQYYEIWNEPNYKSMYSGDINKLVALEKTAYEIIHSVDPAARLVSPSVGIADNAINWPDWVRKFATAGGYIYCDVIGVHLYVSPKPPETVLDMLQTFKANLGNVNKPIWNTEFGWLIENQNTIVKPQKVVFTKVLSPDEASSYIARYYIINWASDIERCILYSWDHREMGLTEADGVTLKEPAYAYGMIYNWLVGSKMLECIHNVQGMWISVLDRPGNKRALIVWHPDKHIAYTIPNNLRVLRIVDLKGTLLQINRTVIVGPSPILIEGTLLTSAS